MQPSKKVEEKWRNSSCFIERSLFNWVVYTQESYPRRSFQREKGKIEIKSHRHILQRHMAPHENSGKKVLREVIQKCELHERSPCASKFVERTQDGMLHHENQASGVARDLAKNVHKLKNTGRTTFHSLVEARTTPAATSKSPKEREFVVDSGASMHMLSKRDLSSDEIWILCGDPGSPQRW